MDSSRRNRMKVVAFYVASIFAFNAFATQWFDSGVENYTAWPATDWSSTSEATDPVADMAFISGSPGSVSMDFDTGSASLEYAISPAGESDNAPLVVRSTQTFTPLSSETELTVAEGAKGGLAVVSDGDGAYAYYGLVKSGSDNKWVKLDGATPTDPATTPVSTRITLTNGGANGWTIAYEIIEGDPESGTVTPLTYNSEDTPAIIVTNAVTKALFTGSGTLSSLSGEYTIPNYDLTVTNLPAHVHIVNVQADGVEVTESAPGVYPIPKGSTVTMLFSADADYEIAPSMIEQTLVVSGATTFDATVAGVQATAKTYYVTYHANGGTGADATQGYTVETQTSANLAKNVGTGTDEIDFAMSGCVFAGWNTVADGSGTPYGAGQELPVTSGGYDLYARWEPVTFDLTIANIPQHVEIDKVMVGTEEIIFNEPYVYSIRTGSTAVITFKAEQYYDLLPSMVTHTQLVNCATTFDATHAGVAATALVYNVTYHPNGGGGDITTQCYTVETPSVIVKAVGSGADDIDFSNTGYAFAGWNTMPDGSGTAYSAGDQLQFTPSGYDMFAQWTIRYDNLTIANLPAHVEIGKVMVDNEEITASQSGVYPIRNGSTATIYLVTDSPDYELATQMQSHTLSVSGATTFDATAAGVQATAKTYYVTYHANGGTGADVTQGYTVETQTSANLAKEIGTAPHQIDFAMPGYDFVGWNTVADGSGTSYAVGDDLPVTSGGYDLYAQWIVATYSITLNPSDCGFCDTTVYQMSTENVQTVHLTYTNTPPIGMQFDGWDVNGGVVAEDKTTWTITAGTYGDLTATPKFAFTKYTIKVRDSAGTANPNFYTYTNSNFDVVLTPAAPAMPGYGFSGWATPSVGTVSGNVWTIPASVTGNLEIVCQTAPITYSVIIDEIGGTGAYASPSNFNVTAGIVVTLTPGTKSGYTFDHWYLATQDSLVTLSGNTLTIGTGRVGDVQVNAVWRSTSGGTPITPGGNATVVDGPDEGTVRSQVTIAVPTAATDAGVSAEAYRSLFDVSVTSLGNNQWSVSVVLKQSVADAQTAAEGPATTTTKAIPISDIAAGTAEGSMAVSSGLTPGLYYSIEASNDVGFPSDSESTREGARTMADGKGSATLALPEKPSTGNSVFYRTHVDVTAGSSAK